MMGRGVGPGDVSVYFLGVCGILEQQISLEYIHFGYVGLDSIRSDYV